MCQTFSPLTQPWWVFMFLHSFKQFRSLLLRQTSITVFASLNENTNKQHYSCYFLTTLHQWHIHPFCLSFFREGESVAGPTRVHRQPFALTLTPTFKPIGNWEFSIKLSPLSACFWTVGGSRRNYSISYLSFVVNDYIWFCFALNPFVVKQIGSIDISTWTHDTHTIHTTLFLCTLTY